MKIEIDCSEKSFSEGEFMTFLFARYHRSPLMNKVLWGFLFLMGIMIRMENKSFENDFFNGLFIIGWTFFYLLFIVFFINPIYIFKTKKLISEYRKEGYHYSLVDDYFTVSCRSFKITADWSSVEKVRVRAGNIHLISRLGLFYISRSWIKRGELMELKALLDSKGVKNNIR